MSPTLTRHRISVDDTQNVSALWTCPAGATAAYVFAHGAGAGMEHVFMSQMAAALAERAIATLRFNFPYMENASKRPDRPAVAHATIRAAVASAKSLAPSVPLFAGGKSFGGRMTSQAQAAAPLPHVEGLIFLGFPLHPAKKPSIERAAHLARVKIPMLFVQGDRDALADLSLLAPIVSELPSATLHVEASVDHSFAAPANSGRGKAGIIASVADAVAAWCRVR